MSPNRFFQVAIVMVIFFSFQPTYALNPHTIPGLCADVVGRYFDLGFFRTKYMGSELTTKAKEITQIYSGKVITLQVYYKFVKGTPLIKTAEITGVFRGIEPAQERWGAPSLLLKVSNEEDINLFKSSDPNFQSVLHPWINHGSINREIEASIVEKDGIVSFKPELSLSAGSGYIFYIIERE